MSDETTPQESAAMSPASAGSHGKPVAWLITGKWTAYQEVTINKARAYSPGHAEDVVVTPLYRSLTLTDEEREAVHRLCRAVTHYSAGGVAVDGGSFARDDERAVAVVRGWLARLT